MNERFDEIVRQTRLYNQSVYDNGEGGWIVQTAELKKFAELIVQECAKEFMASHKYGNPMAKTAVKDAARHVKRHFGVE